MMAVSWSVAGRVFPALEFARCISTSALLAGRGIRGAIKGLRLEEKELQEIEPDELDEMTHPSFDTFNQEVSHIDHDARRYQHLVRRKTIERKYFKPAGPFEENLLTWSMKEQLKYLHSSDPNQWSPEVLSKSFPITPEGAARLLHSHWQPKSEKERERHDRAVTTRWKKHLKGQIGSYKILEKTLNNKFHPESLPSPVAGMKDILNILEGLRFDGEQPPVANANAVRKGKKVPKQTKRPGKSFYSIIEDYNVKTSDGEELKEEESNTNILSRVSGPPEYAGTYSKVTSVGTPSIRQLPRHKKRTLMTYSEFMKNKT